MNWPDDFINKVICGDCLEVMKEMPDKCVNLTWADPPYNVGKDYGVYKDNLNDKDYLVWVIKVMQEIRRVSQQICILVPTKYGLEYWRILGPEFRQIILSYSPEGAIRYGFVNQYSFILTNGTPLRYCKNVWHNCQMSNLGYFFKENNFSHPGYTSEDLSRRVLHYFSMENDLVLDPFAGVGSTMRACKDYKRNFIGIEINPDYCKIAEERLAQGVL